jgi:hypothetical protein
VSWSWWWGVVGPWWASALWSAATYAVIACGIKMIFDIFKRPHSRLANLFFRVTVRGADGNQDALRCRAGRIRAAWRREPDACLGGPDCSDHHQATRGSA